MNLIQDDKIDKIIDDIIYKKPKTPFTYFMINELDIIKLRIRDEQFIFNDMH